MPHRVFCPRRLSASLFCFLALACSPCPTPFSRSGFGSSDESVCPSSREEVSAGGRVRSLNYGFRDGSRLIYRSGSGGAPAVALYRDDAFPAPWQIGTTTSAVRPGRHFHFNGTRFRPAEPAVGRGRLEIAHNEFIATLGERSWTHAQPADGNFSASLGHGAHDFSGSVDTDDTHLYLVGQTDPEGPTISSSPSPVQWAVLFLSSAENPLTLGVYLGEGAASVRLESGQLSVTLDAWQEVALPAANDPPGETLELRVLPASSGGCSAR